MINVSKIGDKLIGTYHIYLSNDKLAHIAYAEKDFVIESFWSELAEQDQSGLFSYSILSINNNSSSADLFGVAYEIIFEFVPNKELIDEIKVVAERLEIGL